jgi:hypothetical protein
MLATNAGLLTPILGDPSPWNPERLYINGEAGAWYDPSDLTAEKVAWRRNLLTWSEQLDNAAWTKVNATVTANATTAPNGTTTADKLVDDAFTGPHNVQQGVAMRAGQAYTASIYAKQDQIRYLFVRYASGGAFSANYIAIFDLQNGTAANSPSLPVSAFAIENVGSGWYRCSITQTADASGTGTVLFLLSKDGITSTYSGNGTDGAFLWGAQVDIGTTASAYQRITDFTSDFLAAFPTHALYQDSAGTTPVTVLGQPVGLALDKSRGALTNATAATVNENFASGGTGWSGQAGWTVSTGQASVNSSVAGSTYLRTSAPSIVGAMYRITFTISSISGGPISAAAGTNNGTLSRTTPGTYTEYLVANSTAGVGVYASGSTVVGTVTNVSAVLVPGVHAIQPTSASRPALDARVNLLTYSEQFDNAAWSKTAVTVTANNAAAPDGTTTADLITPAASTAYHAVNQNIAMVVGTAYTVLAYFKQTVGGARYGYLLIGGNNKTGVFDTQTGTVTFTSAGISSASMLSVGNGWYLCVMTLTAASGDSNVFMGPTTSATTGNAATAATDTILLWGADVRLATDAAYPYQRVVTATDYADVGVPRSFLHDGFDDGSYTASSLDLSGTDKVTVWAGVYKNSDAATGIMYEHSADTNTNDGSFRATIVAGEPRYYFLSKGTTQNGVATGTGFAAPISSVMTGIADIAAPNVAIRVNGVQQVASSASQGAGNYGNRVFYIGRRGNTTLPFNGKIYTIIIRGGVTDAATLALTERYVGSRMGIVL